MIHQYVKSLLLTLGIIAWLYLIAVTVPYSLYVVFLLLSWAAVHIAMFGDNEADDLDVPPPPAPEWRV